MLPQCQCAANIAPHPEDEHPQPGSPATPTFDSLPNQENSMPYTGDLASLQVDSSKVSTGNISTVSDPFITQPEGALEHPLHPSLIAAIAECLEDVHPNPGIAEIFESPLQDATPILQAEEGPSMSPICCFEASMAISATPSTDLPPATNTTTEGGPYFPSHSPPAGPVLGDLISSESWDESQLWFPIDLGDLISSESRDESQLCPPTDLDQDIPVEVMSANPDTCISLFDLLHRPEHKQRKHDFFHQIGGQATHGRSPVCPRCRQECSGRSEMVRHFYSLHLPPTIGCRICKDYKQSRMDSFKSHCKKRHSSESIEGFIVPLENLMIRFTRRRYDQRAETS